MSIEKDLGRIADALEKISRMADGLAHLFEQAAAGDAKPAAAKTAKPAKAAKPAAEPEAEPEAAGEVTLEEVKEAARALVKKEGKDAVFAVLEPFGASKVSDLAPEQYAEVKANLETYEADV